MNSIHIFFIFAERYLERTGHDLVKTGFELTEELCITDFCVRVLPAVCHTTHVAKQTHLNNGRRSHMGSRKINQLEKKKGGRSPPTVKVKTKQVPQYKTGLTTSMWCTIAGFYGRSNRGTIEVVKEVDNALFFYIFFLELVWKHLGHRVTSQWSRVEYSRSVRTRVKSPVA